MPTATFTSGDRLLLLIATLLVPVAIVLMRVHTLFTLLTLPFCLLSMLGAAALFSRYAIGKSFVPISKHDTAEDAAQQEWTDYVLTWSAILAGLLLLFAFGEVADCLRAENVWHGDLLPIRVDVCALLGLRGGG